MADRLYCLKNEIVVNVQVIVGMADCMNNIFESPVLQSNQNIDILNQCMLPKLTYSLQAEPVRKIEKHHLDRGLGLQHFAIAKEISIVNELFH